MENPKGLGVGGELKIERRTTERDFAAEFETGGVDLMEVGFGKCPDGREDRVADDLGGAAIDTDVAGNCEGGEIDGGDGTALFIGDKGVAFKSDSALFGAGGPGNGGGSKGKVTAGKQLLPS